jgi:hypothetical protein
MTRVIKHFVVWSLAIALLFSTGCATHSKEVKTETTHYPATGQPTVVERETTVTTDSEEGSGGVVSGTVNVVGEVLALPFRAVGGLIRAVF